MLLICSVVTLSAGKSRYNMTKSSSSRKRKSGKKLSKLSQMRKRLTLKSRVSPVRYEMDNKLEETTAEKENTQGVQLDEENFGAQKTTEEHFDEVNMADRKDDALNEEERAIVISQVGYIFFTSECSNFIICL